MKAHAGKIVWQWSVPVGKSGDSQSRAWLWIPPDCKAVKAVIFAQQNMEEQSILENPKFRKEMGKLGIAEVWVSPGYDLVFDFSKGSGDLFSEIMSNLSMVSGYQELSFVPFIGLGHSWAASAPYAMAAWSPERALACISVSGQWPYIWGAFAPDIWGDRNIDFIPSIVTMGEYEGALNFANEGLRQRSANQFLPLSMLTGPAQGHFNAAQEKIDFLSFYIKKVLHFRLPKHSAAGKQPKLIPIDPTKTGWLAERWMGDYNVSSPAAPVDDYTGNKQEAFWYFDQETVRMVEKYQARHKGKKHQLIGFTQDDKFAEQRSTHQQFDLVFNPLPDGVTFKLQAKFYDTVPGGSPRPANWTGLAAGSHVGHVQGVKTISIDPIAGPVKKINDSIFSVHPQLGYPLLPRSYEAWFVATDLGDRFYRPAVQQAKMNIPVRNLKGRVQNIIFKPLVELTNPKSFVLKAVSDAGLPVGFYVLEGPAVIVDGILKLCKVPPSAKFPVKITVVAYQYGSNSEPFVQTAEEVKQVYWLQNNR